MDTMPSERQGVELQRTESIPLVDYRRKLLRRINKCLGSEENQLCESLPRFGPLYRIDPSLERIDKERTWQHVLRKSLDREAITTEIYLSAMRRIERKARDTYAEGTVDRMTGSQFRWMMIKDGCLFLQMALFILGRSKQLGYPPDDEIFGRKHNLKEMKGWTKSMFFVGNQIPFVVLKELMNQRFFQQVISEGKWNEVPSDLFKKTLYEFLVFPALKIQSHKTYSKQVDWMMEQPIDLIHALQLLVLGPQKDDTTEEEDDEESEDEEINNLNEGDQSTVTQRRQEVINVEAVSDEKSCPSATELRRQGIHFEVCSGTMEAWQAYLISINKLIQACRYLKIVKGMGGRGITYVNHSILSTALFLPPLLVDDDTELLLQCLKNYEISQPVDKKKRDFSSYIRFMSELIRTREDANLLYSKGIIQGNRRYREKLPRIFSKLVSKDNKYNHNFRALTLKISDYNRPSWKNIRNLLSFISLLTLVQTVYAVLSYHKGNDQNPQQSH